ncbi:Dna2-domain-containing protein [Glonium stellatum]|uniref:Dna2-domain-containing protein n=1 Tax=Glonium stellatum TaxID=574774 RepID=A0A8E2F457_9PEZI|nr:Dna2-domain-containing protein [Glonium stellatum]
MSSRQRSFFDQDPKPKARPLWHRTRSANDVSRTNNTTKDAMTGPPISASTQTKSKLKAFQFVEGRPTSNIHGNDADKENRPFEFGIEASKDKTKSQRDTIPLKTNQTPKLVQSKTCPPSTPATRLPLVDLVGNSDDGSKHATTHNISPDEQLYWQMAQSPPSSNPTATPAPRRGKKRARSSSPPGPSQTESSTFFVANEPFDLQNMQQTLRTPQADPAADLWSRYTVNANNKSTPTTNKGVAFAHLINESSPHSSATAGSVSGLRRWASCGLEWPTSVSKRRKTRGVFRENGEDVFGVRSTADEQSYTKSKLSKVGLLVERIQETLAKPPRPNASSLPSSSSPLPETGDFHEAPSASPLQRLAHGPIKDVEEPQQPFSFDGSQETITHEDGGMEKRQPSSSSEFGDADIDMDMVEAMEIASCTADISATTRAGVLFNSTQNFNRPLDSPITAEPIKEDSFGSDDEFDLGDEDNFAADLENLASLFDSRPASTPTKAQDQGIRPAVSLPIAPTLVATEDPGDNGSSDDEFGSDDIDVEQFAVAEAMATQAYNAGAASQAPSQRTARAIQRYLVTLVTEGRYKNDRGHQYPEKVLLVEQEKTKLTKVITLRQSWFDTPCTSGSFVHIIGDFTPTGQCFIDDANGMLILHPDHLISATVVADSFSCLRRAVLQDRVKATSRANAPMLYGTILHELFQEALKANRWDSEWLHNTIQDILPRKYETILEIGASIEQVVDHLKSKLPELQSWAETGNNEHK